jgi:hypothetical protein
MKKFLLTAAGLAIALPAFAKEPPAPHYRKIQVSDKFWAEGATFGDFNHDGKADVASGPYWYEGPDFQKKHQFYPATKTFKRKTANDKEETIEGFEGALGTNNAYSDNFFSFSYDFNKDGWDDILVLGFPGEASMWYENPKGKEGDWVKHVILDVTDNESPTFADITGDGKPEIICSSKGFYGYASPDWSDPAKPWKFHPISPNNNYHKFTHGIGFGDVNGDKRMDLLEANGWWEQPASLAGDPVWTFHPLKFSTGGSQMFAYDVNGDGLNDVITSVAAHGYGLVWWEQVRENGQIGFKEHLILEKSKTPNAHGVTFSQLHAVDLIDVDGDGVKDIVTGKRFWAHGMHGDPDPMDPAVLYWFKLERKKDKTVDFIPHLIDSDSGVGTQVMLRDINKDKRPDIVVGNKKGTFVFLSEKPGK